MDPTRVGPKNAGVGHLYYLQLTRIFFACTATLLVMVAFGIYEAVYLDRGVLVEGAPEWDNYFLYRAVALMACAGLIVFNIQRASRFGPKPKFDHIGLKMRKAVMGSAVTSIVFAILFMLSPKAFSDASLEDGIVEWASAIALFLGFVFYLQASARAYATRSKIEAITLAAFAGLLFLICMEEVSWLQRAIGYQTPYWLSGESTGRGKHPQFRVGHIRKCLLCGSILLPDRSAIRE